MIAPPIPPAELLIKSFVPSKVSAVLPPQFQFAELLMFPMKGSAVFSMTHIAPAL